MKVIGINGSARKNSNTKLLILEVFKELEKEGIETKLIELAGLELNGCKACFGCAKDRNCIHKTDKFREIFEEMKSADGIILGSPVYSANISSNMQALIERAAVVSDMHEGLLKHKVGASVIASRRGGAILAYDTINHFFLNHEMFIAGSKYWNFAIGKLPGDVLNDDEGISNMHNLGKNMAYLLKKLNN